MKKLPLIAASAILATVSAQVLADQIKVGSIAAVTGPIAELAVSIIGGRNLAASHVNKQGGLLDGKTYKLVLADSQCDPKAGVDAGSKIVNVEQVVAIIGASCSGATISMVQSVTIPAAVTSISDSATAPSLTDLNDNDLVFRVAPSDAYQGTALAQVAREAGYHAVAMTYANDDYNVGIAAVFEREFKQLGGTIVSSQIHEPNKPSYRSELSTLSRGNPEMLVIFAYYGGSGITIIRNSLENGLFSRFLGADGMVDQSVIDQIGAENLRGNIMLTQSASDETEVSYQMYKEASDKIGHKHNSPYAANGYDAAFLIALAIEQAGSADRARISQALRQVANAPGEIVRPGEWRKAKALIAASKDINYEGATGSVDFDRNGDVAGLYSVNTVGADGQWQTKLLQ